jgi:5-(carboxyamino)imidazole ribonucleotide synthase
MVFDPRANLVDYLASPASISSEIATQCNEIALKVAKAFNCPGLFAVELFLTPEGQVLVNETAPRLHNSGHHTIEANMTSQFEQLTRILCGWPLGDTSATSAAVMMNILGPDTFSGPWKLDGWEKIAAMPGVFVHLYGKDESRPWRKLGHITIIGKDADACSKLAAQVKNCIKVIAA